MNDNNFDEKYRQQQFNSYLDIMQQSLDKLKKEQAIIEKREHERRLKQANKLPL